MQRLHFRPTVLATIAVASLAIFFALGVAGCGGDEQKPEPGGKVTIRISHWWGDAQDVWKEAIAEFEKSHPNIKVEQQVLSFNVHKDKVLAGSATSTDVGDLVLLEDWFAQELLERDFLVDLAPWYQRDLKPEEIFPLSLGTFTKDGALRAFPIALGSYPLYYNKKLFDAAGIGYPDSNWTYDTLLAAAKKMTRDDDGDGKPDQWGFLLDNGGGFDGFLWSNGGAVLTDDMKRSAFGEPRTVAALNQWVAHVRTHKVAPQNASILGGTSSGGTLRPFETGRFAMALLPAFLTTYGNTPFAWDIALPPKGAAGRKCLRFAAAFGVPRSSKNPEAAWEFLRWAVKEMPAKYAGSMFFGLVPNSRRLAASKEYLEGAPRTNRSALVAMIEKYSFVYWRTGWLEFRDQGFLPEIDLMVNGEKTVEQGAADGDARINEVLGSR